MFLPSSHSCVFHTDTHCTQPLPQWNRSSRCTILGWSIATQYSEIITPSCLYHHLIPVSCIQTLSTLDLRYNEIGDQGAQYLGEALRHNTVRSSLLHVFYHHLIPVSFIQTLTKLELYGNHIGAQGAQYFERLKKTNSHLTVWWWFNCRFQFSGLRLITNRWNLRDIHNYALVCVCYISS